MSAERVIRVLVALDSDVDRDVVQASLPEGGSEIEIVGLVDGLEESWRILQETTTDVLVVACAGYSDRTLFLIDGAVKQRSERPVIVLATEAPVGFVRRVFEVGADDIIALPEPPENVRFALQKALARRDGSGNAAGTSLAPMICVLGPKGGTGKTVTTANMTASLALRGNRVAAVDLDLQFGDLGLALGLAPDRTIYDLAKSGGSLDADKLDAYLATHASGARVLLAPVRPDQATFVSVEFLREVYGTLRAMHDYVVVDTPPGFTPEVIASIDASSHVCMVGMLDSLSLKNTKLGLETLDLMGYDRGRIRLVLNRADSRVGISRQDVEAIIGRAPDVFVPSERDIPKSINEGVPIVASNERSEAAEAFRELARQYVIGSETAASNGAGLRGLLRRKS